MQDRKYESRYAGERYIRPKYSQKSTARPVSRRSGGYKIRMSSGSVDYLFLGTVILLLAYGLIMQFSASSGAAYANFGNAYHFVLRQGAAMIAGGILMFFTSKIDYHTYGGKAGFAAYAAVAVMLIAVLVAGEEVNGAKRWIFGFQPSEAAKAVIVVVLAYFMSLPNKQRDLRRVESRPGRYVMSVIEGVVVPHGLIIGLYCLLLAFQPHFSCILLIVAVAAVMFVAAGIPWRHCAICGIAVAAALIVYGMSEEYRMARLTSFLDPFKDMRDTGYQIVQSLYAIGSGGIFGVGLGKSRQKFQSLPEPHNDFIFSVLCEELGFVGALILIALFVFLLYRGLKIAKNAPDLFGTLMATGFVALVIIQAAMNIAVVTASIPATGIPLPFFSYGGTAIVVTMAELGIVMNVSRQSKMLL